MLALLGNEASQRKLRLFGCACCRRMPHPFFAPWQAAVEAVERLADASREIGGEEVAWEAELTEHNRAAHLAARTPDVDDVEAERAAAFAIARLTERSIAPWVAEVAHAAAHGTELPAVRNEEFVQAKLLRCILGNPFRPFAFAPAWRSASVGVLAQAAYEERSLLRGELDGVRLAILADALEEAGAGGELLDHLRGPGPHVLGCFAVDACLGWS
jgi:hypothetical protein